MRIGIRHLLTVSVLFLGAATAIAQEKKSNHRSR